MIGILQSVLPQTYWASPERDRRERGFRVFHRDDGEVFGAYLRKKPCILPEAGIREDEEDGDFNASFRWLWLSVNLRIKKGDPKVERKWDFNGRWWGWYVMDGAELWMRWGHAHAVWKFPFLPDCDSGFIHEIFSADGERVIFSSKGRSRRECEKEHDEAKTLASRKFDYTYVRKNGEVQKTTATCFIEQRSWRRKWTPFWFRRKSLDVWFDDEVGEGVDSWKGGTIGCGIDMLKGETMEQALRRMEATREFSR